MINAKEFAITRITELVKKYESLTSSQIKHYNEEATKQGFILPLFKALGWDIEDSAGEVMPEYHASKGRVDYAFRINGVSQFYVEAKSLGSDLTNPNFIKQTVTYAYNKGVTWALLTNFSGIRLFNAQKLNSYINLNCTDYITDFDKLWLLSRDSLKSGLLNQEAAKQGALPQSLPIEKRLFNQLRQWREDIYNQLLSYHEGMSPQTANRIIQSLFNRLIFIRTCEDRNIEDKRLIAALHQSKSGPYQKNKLLDILRGIFQEFDGYYDSELFAHGALDDDQIFIEQPTVEAIVSGLYDIPGAIAHYDFSLIDADILGQVYEQYLGYVAAKARQKKQTQLTLELPGQAKIEFVNKKEHRKEQGIYYTPKFVTDLIVKVTIGEFIQSHTYEEISNIRILDPACGSGSFLIRAYDELLEYHAAYIGKEVENLTQEERLPILKKNIFGVDLDHQAVEIARLNLLLRSLTERNKLPTLGDNIKMGNSLISGTPESLKVTFGKHYSNRHPFNWIDEYPNIIKSGGFDIIIGNPPYGAELDKAERNYVTKTYPHSKSNKNSAMVFIERGFHLLKEDGYFAFIVPKSLAYSQKWRSGRELIIQNLGYAYDTSKAFKDVLLEQMVFVVSQKYSDKTTYNTAFLDESGLSNKTQIEKNTSISCDTILLGLSDKELEVFKRMTASGKYMKDISNTARGLPFQKHLQKSREGEAIYRGGHVGRYALFNNSETIDNSSLDSAKEKVAYLLRPKIMSQQILAHIQKPVDHIMLMSTLDKKGVLTLDTVQNTILYDETFTLEMVTALLNSKLWSWYAYRFIYSRAVRTMHFDGYYIEKFPLPIFESNNAKKAANTNLVGLVTKIQKFNSHLVKAKASKLYEDHSLKKEIEIIDSNIDDVVYQLYGLTKDEIQIIKSGMGD